MREYGITDLVTWAVPPGMRPEQMNGSLERFCARRGAARQRRRGRGGLRKSGAWVSRSDLAVRSFRFPARAAYWRWIDMCEAGGVDLDLADRPDRRPSAVP